MSYAWLLSVESPAVMNQVILHFSSKQAEHNNSWNGDRRPSINEPHHKCHYFLKKFYFIVDEPVIFWLAG